MKKISQINQKDSHILKYFLLEQKKDFNNFIELGWNIETIQNQFLKKNNFSLGFFDKNKLLGFLLGDIIKSYDSSILDIYVFFVVKNERRKNIGSSILQYIETNKEIINISEIYLEVEENNIEAIKFYEKNNFVFVNFRHNYYKYKNKKINAKCFLKKFK